MVGHCSGLFGREKRMEWRKRFPLYHCLTANTGRTGDGTEKAGKPIVLVLVSGRPLELNRLESQCDAILEIWQPGVNGARSMAGILSGRINPSGKLAITFPYSTGQIPIYYNRRKSGRRGNQGIYQDITSEPLYPFGHGLSYTEFKYGTVTPSATRVKRGENSR